ncbi:MAG: hypothetical protein ACK40M_00665 [Flavobacteriales bacterium]
MQVVWIVLLVIIAVVFAWIILGSGDSGDKRKKEPEAKVNVNPYENLRNQALNMDHKTLGIQIGFDEERPFGVVMDWYVGNGVATLACFSTGDASLYFSGGTTMIGGIGIPAVKELAPQYVMNAAKVIPLCSKVNAFPPPDPQTVKFYILTNKGKYAGSESMAQFQTGQSSWFPLFIDANTIMAELRKKHEGQPK